MMAGEEFIDYYEILQIHPNCSRSILDSAYRSLAKQYHPDHPETADPAMFYQVTAAYNVLKRPDKRGEYDVQYASRKSANQQAQGANGAQAAEEMVAASDGQIQQGILLMLYKQRRNNAADPGLNAYKIQQAFNCSDDSFEFHLWYLKAKGYVNFDEQGMLAITIDGVDHVISVQQQQKATETLLLSRANSKD